MNPIEALRNAIAETEAWAMPILRPCDDIEIETYEGFDPRVGIGYYGWQVYFDEYSLIDSGITTSKTCLWLRTRWAYLQYRFGCGKA
jgi:hypothetical protein